MPVITESASVGERIQLRRPRTHIIQPISETDPHPPPHIPSIVQSARSKSTISSFLVPSFSIPTTSSSSAGTETISPAVAATNKKKNGFSSTTFRGLGCAASASQQVSVPAVIRSSADWQGKKTRDKKQKKTSKNKTHQGIVDEWNSNLISNVNSTSCLDIQDVWCGPGIGFSADAAASVDCVVARRNVSNRSKIDGEKMNQREGSSLARQITNPEAISFFDSDPELEDSHPSEIFGTRYCRHFRNPSPEGLTEQIMMFQNNWMMSGRFESQDQYRELRLDVDNMSYEELLELGDRIGHVSTGLKDEEIGHFVMKTKLSTSGDFSKHLLPKVDKKCSICQEEFEGEDEVGKLSCGHGYHLLCIKQWLARKNACPVCKTAVTGQQHQGI